MSTNAGLHEPVIPLMEVVASAGTISFEQIVRNKPKPKTGVMFGLTVTAKVAAKAHNPGSGVNVYTAEF